MTSDTGRIAIFSTKGSGSNEESRIRTLLEPFAPTVLPFDKAAKRSSALNLLRDVARRRPDLLVMEGTGLAGGLACLWARLRYGTRYVVSSGDAVGPFVAAHSRSAGPAFALYERVLCRFAAGYIGWTPYLVGRALTFGTPRAVTAAGWSPLRPDPAGRADMRRRVRERLGIGPDALVVGIVGSLVWNPRVKYCYGLELVRAMARVKRSDAVAVVVGGGSGLAHLQQLAASLPAGRVILTGGLPFDAAFEYMAAMDVGSLPQSVDGVGSFRYTTKISEYAAAGLPVVTGHIPMAYDLAADACWRLPGDVPWADDYVAALAGLIDELTPSGVERKQAGAAALSNEFDATRQAERVTEFVSDLLADSARQRPAVAAADKVI